MNELMTYGKISTIETTDEIVRDSRVVTTSRRYEERMRIHSDQQELTEFLLFRDATRELKHVEFRIEHTQAGDEKGYWDIIKVWTV